MNWGNRLLLAFIIFGVGLSFLVYKSTTTNYDLVEKDYYNKEINYQQVIDGSKKASALSSDIIIKQKNNLIIIQLPSEMKNKSLQGQIWFYCAYNSKNDKKYELQTDSNALQIINSELIKTGSYTVKITWKDEATSYYVEKNLEVI